MTATHPRLSVGVTHVWPGVPAWPETSRPPSGVALSEACWLLGLPSAKFVLERPIAPERAVHASKADTVGQAREHPLLRRLLQLEGVHTALAWQDAVIVSSRLPEDRWPDLIVRVEAALLAHYDVDEAALRRKIEAVLTEEINPGIASHGGFIRLQELRGATAVLEMSGGCQGCGMAAVTLRQGVERTLKERVPEVTEVVDSTDHSAGTRPFYASSH